VVHAVRSKLLRGIGNKTRIAACKCYVPNMIFCAGEMPVTECSVEVDKRGITTYANSS
jgi:hypothetical protein